MSKDDQLPEDADEWDAKRALENLKMEHALDAHGTPQTTAKRLFEEALPVATMAITHLAMHSATEVIRFNAAKYVVERTMGPAERVVSVDGRHAWDDIYESVTDEAENYLKQ
jgi:hypothetical protein